MEYNQKKKRRSKAVLRLAVACGLFLCMGIGNWYVFAAPVSYISVDINPSVELTLNRLNRVTAAEMKKLLAGKPITVKNIPKKNGTGTYDAKLTLRWDGKYPTWDMSFLPSKKAASK